MFRYLCGGQHIHQSERRPSLTVGYLRKDQVRFQSLCGGNLRFVRTPIDHIILRHLFSCSGRLLLIYPLGLIPMVVRNDSKLDGCVRQFSHSPARRVAKAVRMSGL
jgi:hypothetical protein